MENLRPGLLLAEMPQLTSRGAKTPVSRNKNVAQLAQLTTNSGFASPENALDFKFRKSAVTHVFKFRKSALVRLGQHAGFHVKAHGGELACLCAMGGDENRFTR